MMAESVVDQRAKEDALALSGTEARAARSRARGLLRSLVEPLRGRVGATAAVLLVSQVFAVAGPLLVAYGLDTGLPRLLVGDAVPAAMSAVFYAMSGIIEGALMAVAVRMTAGIAQSMLIDLRSRMFRHTQRLGLEFHERYTSGRIISRQTNDLESLSELMQGSLDDLVSGTVYMVFIAIAILVLDPVSGIVLLSFLVPMGIVFAWFRRRSEVLYRESSSRSAKLIVTFVETMTGIRAVQSFRTERRNQARYERLSEEYRATNRSMMGAFSVLYTAIGLIGDVALGALVLVDGFRVVSGGLGLGVLMAAVLYARQFFDPLQSMGEFYNSFQAAGAALEKISGVLAESPSVPDPDRPVRMASPRGQMALEGVSFGYAGAAPVLSGLSLRIPAGQTVALVGETGAGKSTLVKLMARFYDPTFGVVRLDGTDLREIDPVDFRRAVVMVTQEAYLFGGSVADNIALGRPGASRREIERAADAVGAGGFIRALPHGFDTDVRDRGGRVSAGQRQLVSFARAFLADPAVLILDEASSSLDMPGERAVQAALDKLLADRTAVVIAHRLSTVTIADRVVVMRSGRIVEDGSPSELLETGGRFAAMHRAWQDSLA